MKKPAAARLRAPVWRTLPAERWINITMRSLHLIGVAGAGGAFLYAAPADVTAPFLQLTLLTGIILTLIYLWTHPGWWATVSGLAILLKVVLLALAVALPAWQAPLFILVIIVSGLIAHAPGWVRGYRLFARGALPNP